MADVARSGHSSRGGHTTRRRVAVAAGVLAIAALLAIRWLAKSHDRRQDDSAPSPPVRPTAEGAPARLASPAPAQRSGSPFLPAHSAVATELGYVALSCWVGPEWDSDRLVGEWHQRIRGGWYSNVEQSTAGRHVVEERVEGGGFESLFYVSWENAEPGGVSPCRVEAIARAAIEVTVVDLEGDPVVGARVYGCGGGSGESDAFGGVVLDDVYAGERCGLKAYRVGTPATEGCEGIALLEPLTEGERRPVEIAVSCARGRPERSQDEVPSEPVERLEVAPHVERAALTRLAARDLGPESDALIDGLIRHHERIFWLGVALDLASGAMQSAIDALQWATTPEEVEASLDDLDAAQSHLQQVVPREANLQ